MKLVIILSLVLFGLLGFVSAIDCTAVNQVCGFEDGLPAKYCNENLECVDIDLGGGSDSGGYTDSSCKRFNQICGFEDGFPTMYCNENLKCVKLEDASDDSKKGAGDGSKEIEDVVCRKENQVCEFSDGLPSKVCDSSLKCSLRLNYFENSDDSSGNRVVNVDNKESINPFRKLWNLIKGIFSWS